MTHTSQKVLRGTRGRWQTACYLVNLQYLLLKDRHIEHMSIEYTQWIYLRTSITQTRHYVKGCKGLLTAYQSILFYSSFAASSKTKQRRSHRINNDKSPSYFRTFQGFYVSLCTCIILMLLNRLCVDLYQDVLLSRYPFC